MAVLEGLKPEKVFQYFEAICQIPHGSGNTKELSDWLAAFAQERGLECHQDELNDIIIIKEASAGYEAADPVIIQGHMDMVCDKVADCEKDMASEGLDVAIDGDNIYAVGTTLGGDDGIAVAFMLAILDDDSLQHPRVECVFTVDEETGLYGAEAIDVAPLKGTRFLNLDSEDEGIATVGCAGGVTGIAHLPVSRESYDGKAFTVELSGFLGGHSGTEIIKGQENAIRVLGRLMFELQDKAAARIVAIDGGVADNVIPVSAKATFISPDGEKVKAICDEYRGIFEHEFKVDPGFTMTLSETTAEAVPFDAVSGQKAIAYLIGSPNGIEKMTVGIDGLPQTSLSLGVSSARSKPSAELSTEKVRIRDGNTTLFPRCAIWYAKCTRIRQARTWSSRPSTPVWNADSSPARCLVWTAYPSDLTSETFTHRTRLSQSVPLAEHGSW